MNKETKKRDSWVQYHTQTNPTPFTFAATRETITKQIIIRRQRPLFVLLPFFNDFNHFNRGNTCTTETTRNRHVGNYLSRGVDELLVDVRLGVEFVGDLAQDPLLHAAVKKRMVAALLCSLFMPCRGWMVCVMGGPYRHVRTTPSRHDELGPARVRREKTGQKVQGWKGVGGVGGQISNRLAAAKPSCSMFYFYFYFYFLQLSSLRRNRPV